jgi:hypothetical protein
MDARSGIVSAHFFESHSWFTCAQRVFREAASQHFDTPAKPGQGRCMQFNFRAMAAAAIVTVAVSVPAMASSVSWESVATISSDSDVSTTGAFVRAYTFGVPSTTIDTVTFSPFSANTSELSNSDDGTTTANGFTGSYGEFGTGSGGTPYANLTSEYQNLITGGFYGDTDASITFNDLHSNDTYQIELWVNDSRANGSGRTETFNGDTGTSDPLAYNDMSSAGGVGQFVIGTFVASGTSQTITLSAYSTYSDNPATGQLTGLELRDTTVPEPASVTLLGGIGLGLLARRRFRGVRTQ